MPRQPSKITLTALKLLKPPPDRRRECERDIAAALRMLKGQQEAASAGKVFGSKKGRASIKRYAAALRQLQPAYDSLDPTIKRWFSLVGTEAAVERELTKVEQLLPPSGTPKPDAVKAKLAVAMAYNLMSWWGHKPALTRDGDWEKLSKVLAGGSDVAVFEHMRTFKRNPRLIIKLKGKTSLGFASVKPSASSDRFDN